MKIRIGFVSNSSSASFVLFKHYISAHQMDKIHEYLSKQKEMDCEYWTITEENEDMIGGSTIMDNDEFSKFLDNIGVATEAIKWESTG